MFRFFLIFFLASTNMGLLFGQKALLRDTTEAEMLDEVMVTATRSQRQLSSLPLPAQIVGQEEIARGRNLRLGELLNEQTGLITVYDHGGIRSIQMQGMDSEHILIMLDGVPLIGRTAGSLDIDRVALGNVQQVEIVKGASSSLYGNEGLGGVINVITKQPRSGANAEAHYRAGSFGTHNVDARAQYGRKDWANAFSISAYHHGGYDIGTAQDALNTVEPFENYTLSSNNHYRPSEEAELSFSGRYYYQRQDRVAADTLRGLSLLDEWNAHTKGSYEHSSKWKSTAEFYLTQYHANEFLRNPAREILDERGFRQWLFRPELRSSYSITAHHKLIAGLGSTNEWALRAEFSQNPAFYSPYVYAQHDAFFLKKRLNVLSGFRFDWHNVYASQLSPKLAVRYQWADHLATKASVGYGYKAPAFRQLYFNFTNSTVGYTVLGYEATRTHLPQLEQSGEIKQHILGEQALAKDLRPESSVSYNVGWEFFPIPSLSTSFGLFRNNIRDLIDTRMVARKQNGQGVFSYYNVASVYTQGVETELGWQIHPNVKWSGGYQYLLAKDRTVIEDFENGKVYARPSANASTVQLAVSDYFGLYNRSRHLINTKLFYNLPRWGLDANVRMTYRSRYGLQDTNGNTYLDDLDDFIEGYMIWDVALGKVFYKRYQLALGADNALGFTHPQVSEVPGRIAYVKLSVDFF